MGRSSIVVLTIICFLTSCRGQQNNEVIQQISTAALQSVITDSNIQLIDVRTPLEYNKGFIGNAINANIFSTDFINVANRLDKSKPIYVYCHKGGRSSAAANKLTKLGFSKIYDYSGGWKAWKKKLN